MVHAENGDVIDILVREALAAGHTEPLYHALTRPPEAEGEATTAPSSRASRGCAVVRRPRDVPRCGRTGSRARVTPAGTSGRDVHAVLLPTRSDDIAKPNFEGAK